MRKLALVSLAALAAAALPAAVQAQPRAGHSWGQPGQQQRVIVRQGGPGMHPQPMPGMEQHRQFRQFQRFNRGQFVPSFWWGPQFQVQNWQMYGFSQPMPGYRWVRYYDDAYMIDGRGRVQEGRYGLDWDRYGERWAEDERGIPAYVGDGDWMPNERDEQWAEEVGERHGRGGWDYAEYGREGYGRGPGPGPACGQRRGPCGGVRPPMPYGGPPANYGYGASYGGGYGYGYGMMCCATVTITETVVETGGSSASYEVVEEEVVRERARTVHRRPAPRRPIRGERG